MNRNSKLICLMTVVGVIYKSVAALLKLPASATRMKVSSCGLYITILSPVCANDCLLYMNYYIQISEYIQVDINSSCVKNVHRNGDYYVGNVAFISVFTKR